MVAFGAHLVARLRDIAARHTIASNPRGAGLMCAIDLPDATIRDRVVSALMDRGVLVLGCGTRSLRFRPSLAVSLRDLDAGIDELETVLGALG